MLRANPGQAGLKILLGTGPGPGPGRFEVRPGPEARLTTKLTVSARFQAHLIRRCMCFAQFLQIILLLLSLYY